MSDGVQVLEVTVVVPILVGPTVGCTEPPKKEGTVGGAPGMVRDGADIFDLGEGFNGGVDIAA